MKSEEKSLILNYYSLVKDLKNTKTCNNSKNFCSGFHHRTSKTVNKYIEKSQLGLW
jgi:hypothetical protein